MKTLPSFPKLVIHASCVHSHSQPNSILTPPPPPPFLIISVDRLLNWRRIKSADIKSAQFRHDSSGINFSVPTFRRGWNRIKPISPSELLMRLNARLLTISSRPCLACLARLTCLTFARPLFFSCSFLPNLSHHRHEIFFSTRWPITHDLGAGQLFIPQFWCDSNVWCCC